MASHSTNFVQVSSEVLIFSVVFKSFAMIIGVLGNVTVIIHIILLSKKKTNSTYLIGNLAFADLFVCLSFYPQWIIEFIKTILNIESDQELFCKLSRSTIWSLLFASVATLLAITIDRYLFIVKPLKYPMIVTRRRVVTTISGIWLSTCAVAVVLKYQFSLKSNQRSLCNILSLEAYYIKYTFIGYIPIILILIFNLHILHVAREQRKRILAEITTAGVDNSNLPSKKVGIGRLFHAHKAVKTFLIVFVVLTFCMIIPSVVGVTLHRACHQSCCQTWYVVVHYEFYIWNQFDRECLHLRNETYQAQTVFSESPFLAKHSKT